MSLITISEGIGCGGLAIAQRVADELNVELYDDRRLEQEAIGLGIRPKDLKGLDEKAPGLFSRILSDKAHVYLDLLQAVVYEVAKRSQGIILGHGSQILLRDFGCALHVRVYASESFRVEYLVRERGVGRAVAERLMRKTDEERRGFLQFAFHRDWDDPSQYDLLINRDKLGEELASRLIVAAAQSQEIRECSLGALDSMERLSLARRVEAAVLGGKVGRDVLHPEILHIDIPEKGVVHITGFANTPEGRERMIKAVKGVPGVTDVRSEVEVIPLGSD